MKPQHCIKKDISACSDQCFEHHKGQTCSKLLPLLDHTDEKLLLKPATWVYLSLPLPSCYHPVVHAAHPPTWRITWIIFLSKYWVVCVIILNLFETYTYGGSIVTVKYHVQSIYVTCMPKELWSRYLITIIFIFIILFNYLRGLKWGIQSLIICPIVFLNSLIVVMSSAVDNICRPVYEKNTVIWAQHVIDIELSNSQSMQL